MRFELSICNGACDLPFGAAKEMPVGGGWVKRGHGILAVTG